MGGNLPPGYPSFGAATETSARAAPRCGRVELARALLVPPASAEVEDGREAEGWGFGIPGFCSRFGSTFWAKLNLFGQSYTSHAIPDIRIAIRAYL